MESGRLQKVLQNSFTGPPWGCQGFHLGCVVVDAAPCV